MILSHLNFLALFKLPIYYFFFICNCNFFLHVFNLFFFDIVFTSRFLIFMTPYLYSFSTHIIYKLPPEKISNKMVFSKFFKYHTAALFHNNINLLFLNYKFRVYFNRWVSHTLNITACSIFLNFFVNNVGTRSFGFLSSMFNYYIEDFSLLKTFLIKKWDNDLNVNLQAEYSNSISQPTRLIPPISTVSIQKKHQFFFFPLMQIFADPAYTRTKRDIIDNLSAGTSYNCFIDRGFFPRKNNVNMSVLFFFYQFQNMSIPEMTDKGVTYLGKRNSIKYFSSFNSALLAKSNSTFLDYNHALLSQFPEFKKSCVKGMIFNGYASSRSRKHSSFWRKWRIFMRSPVFRKINRTARRITEHPYKGKPVFQNALAYHYTRQQIATPFFPGIKIKQFNTKELLPSPLLKQLSYSTDSELSLFQMKPGYGSIWRYFRRAAALVCETRARRQWRLTNYFMSLRNIRGLPALWFLENSIMWMLLNSHFVYTLKSAYYLVSKGLVFINFRKNNSISAQLYVSDIISLKFNTLMLEQYNAQTNYKYSAQKKLAKFFLRKPQYAAAKYLKLNRPFFTLFDIPNYLEVDFTILHIVFLYQPVFFFEHNPLIFSHMPVFASRILNWKYIN